MSSSLFVHLIVTVVRLARPRGLQSCSQPARRGAYHRGFVRPFHEPSPGLALRNRLEAFHSVNPRDFSNSLPTCLSDIAPLPYTASTCCPSCKHVNQFSSPEQSQK